MDKNRKRKALLLSLGWALGVMIPKVDYAQCGGGLLGYGHEVEQQSRESLFGNENYPIGINLYNQQFGDEFGGFNLYNQSFEEVPMGSGLLILTAAGAGYALKKRKSNIKKHKS